MNKPITVLTGLDYWLDNLMCNVPQVAMCYHLNGIVKVSDIYVCMCVCVYLYFYLHYLYMCKI